MKFTKLNEWSFTENSQKQEWSDVYPQIKPGQPFQLNFSLDEGSYIANVSFNYVCEQLQLDIIDSSGNEAQGYTIVNKFPTNLLVDRAFGQHALWWFPGEKKFKLYKTENYYNSLEADEDTLYSMFISQVVE